MKSPRAIVDLAAPGLAACMLLLPWAATVEAGEQAVPYTETKLTASDGAQGRGFGNAVAILADTAVIGSAGDDHAGIASGSAYIFQRDPVDPTVWAEIAKLTASDGAEFDSFGISVAISGDTLVIGADFDDDLGRDSGSAYIFARDPLDPRVWSETTKLTATDGTPGDHFGGSVALFGDTALIGARFDDDLGPISGSAYVFERDPVDPTAWSQTAKLTASDGAEYDEFGVSVAMSGDTAVIGASADDDLGFDSGSAYVFERDPLHPTIWKQTAKLTAADGALRDHLAFSVAIYGDTAVVGAWGDDDLGPDAGSAYVFARDPADKTAWAEIAKLTADDGADEDRFGESVAIFGDTAVVGAHLEDHLGRSDAGASYVFERELLDPTVWSQTAKLAASDGARGDSFGGSVAISGDTVLNGAGNDDDLGITSGSAYVYSPQACELALALEPLTVRAGEELRVAVALHHRRPVTVTVPLLLWIEDAAGQVVAQESSPPVTMEPGDHRKLRLAVTLPPSLPPGTYRVLVGVKRMQQGIAWGSRQFEIVE